MSCQVPFWLSAPGTPVTPPYNMLLAELPSTVRPCNRVLALVLQGRRKPPMTSQKRQLVDLIVHCALTDEHVCKELTCAVIVLEQPLLAAALLGQHVLCLWRMRQRSRNATTKGRQASCRAHEDMSDHKIAHLVKINKEEC